MDLHRTGKRSQWEDVPEAKRNLWQRMARRTHGAVTPGNAISFAGAALVAWGLFYIYSDALAAGLLVLSIGRLADIADGIVASRTKTKSPLGEAVDATIDKLSMLAALVVLVIAGVVPVFVISLFAVLNLISIMLGVVSRLRKRIVHPSLPGKFSTGLQWAAFLLYVAAELLRSQNVQALDDFVAFQAGAAVVLSVLIGVGAVRGYATAALGANAKGGQR